MLTGIILLISTAPLAVQGAALDRSKVRRDDSPPPPGPTAAGTVANCSWWQLAEAGQTCADIESINQVSDADFKKWNPAVVSGSACTVTAGNAYCVEAPNAPTPTPTPTPTDAAVAAPGPTQAGVAQTCNGWDLVGKDVTCKALLKSHPGLTLDKLVLWNPAIGSDCTGMWAGYYVCTSIIGFKPDPSGPTPTPTGSGGGAPGPTQDGVAKDCDRWDLVAKTNTCATFTSKYPGVTVDDLVKWNPAIGSDCTGLWSGYYVCTSVKGFIPTPTDNNSSSGTSSASAPGPTQDGVAKDCNRWDLVGKSNTCSTFIAKYPGITVDDLVKWNPAIGSDCTGLWSGYYVCTSVKGFNPGSSTGTPSGSAPGLTQAGVAKDCNRWDLVAKSNTCATFTSKYPGVTVDDLTKWNPAIGSDCTGLWSGYYVCTSVKGFAADPAKQSNTPSPVQEGISKRCKTFHQVVGSDTCWSLTGGDARKIADLKHMNPALGNDCGGLWKGYWICVAEY